MRDPVAAPLDTRVLGTHLRFRIAFVLVGVLAVGVRAVLLGGGGGVLVLVVVLFVALAAVTVTRRPAEGMLK